EGLGTLGGELRGCLGHRDQALAGFQPLGGEGDQRDLPPGALRAPDVGVEGAAAVLDGDADTAQREVEAVVAGEADGAVEGGGQVAVAEGPGAAGEAVEGAAVEGAGGQGPLAAGDVAGDVLAEGAAHAPVDGAVGQLPLGVRLLLRVLLRPGRL